MAENVLVSECDEIGAGRLTKILACCLISAVSVVALVALD